MPRSSCCVLAGFLAAALAVAPARAATVAVDIDTGQDRRPIDPRIYGVNFGTAAQLADPGYTVRRWGGNATTRYNWQVDVHNTAADWFFMNVPGEGGTDLPDDSTANRFLAETLAAGAEPILSIPTIGWTPLASRDKHWGFSQDKYGPQSADECLWSGNAFWCTADAGNGECTGLSLHCDGTYIVGNDPEDTSYASGPQYARDWVAHLQARHGSAAAGGVRNYALDNEPMLWNSTHRDVHAQPATYDEIWQKTVDYATAIKAQEQGAQVFGPVTWGWCDLFGSAADNCLSGTDRDAHGGLPFVQWYLRQICSHQQATGLRLVDYLDLHYYPQGPDVVDFNGNLAVSESAAASARRLRSLKELYDPDWQSESWLADLGDAPPWHYSKPHLLRRVRAWIDAECPGTGLAITEYNWGPDQGASAALAQAEVLGIFGREGVDVATRWVAPAPGSKVEDAFRLLLDYDGNGSRVVGTSVHASSADVDALGAYAVEDLASNRLMLLLVNKATTATTAQLDLGASYSGTWTLYRFDATSTVGEVASGSIDGSSLTVADQPARSASLLVVHSSPATATHLFADGFESP